MDRISHLPPSILHDILSRLPDKDAARTSVLSKAWHNTWSTFPFLVFYESSYEITTIPNDADIRLKMLALSLDKYKLCNRVSRTLLNFLWKGLAIRKFKLVFKSFTPPPQLYLVNDWLKFVCDSGVEVLQLENPRSPYSYYEFTHLPLCVLQAKSLIKLDLFWYFRVDQAFLYHPIKFSSLKVLSLSGVYLGNERVIQNLISSCPLIEKFELVCCSGLNSVSIHGLPKLKVVYIVGIEEVDVDAPSLEDLSYSASCFRTIIPCKINMDKCTNLRELCLYATSIIITDQWFLQLFQKSPLLEKLILDSCYMSDRINISSIHLKVLRLSYCDELEEIKIDAPSLYKCTYQGDGSLPAYITILNSSSQLVLDVDFFIGSSLDLQHLCNFLFELSPVHMPLSLFLGFSNHSTVYYDIFDIQDFSIDPWMIKHVNLCVDSDSEEWNLLLVTSLFWICRPSIVSCFLDSKNKTLVKNFCEKLICRKEDGCCSSSIVKCWWHFLKDVKVSSSFRDYNIDADLKTLLEPFPTLSSKEEEEISRFKEGHINFWLEWQLESN